MPIFKVVPLQFVMAWIKQWKSAMSVVQVYTLTLTKLQSAMAQVGSSSQGKHILSLRICN